MLPSYTQKDHTVQYVASYDVAGSQRATCGGGSASLPSPSPNEPCALGLSAPPYKEKLCSLGVSFGSSFGHPQIEPRCRDCSLAPTPAWRRAILPATAWVGAWSHAGPLSSAEHAAGGLHYEVYHWPWGSRSRRWQSSSR
ncbi:hypothetical protein Mp_1g15220 [Marchantia polymorpha subsp. ruderalis]|uniref:Uncharacterized protein n=2 Tax=Marchantia polymorpha TaxID=3197 RepID=A0AAF6AQE3_MARPO|nr:hypothetical protein MARPO_0033s0139 [Marchantia polymorpha]BBM98663.1 hypothetical protein Mp_1g15220 [Marchantia polymorpha subsp. ruderalis]|eukprot:PTQ41746.1 hypothetical protein MARPO_0033s0139 [Marchantia polymorpha]